ncbi:hypothetical protein IFM89_001399 [Coptis chinensis]|uniref:FAR1 domain-containing protein n=1 Tax=Coptis chinensis TaxID=261450 RepID=A0A835HSV8_9MAGN|nr:hypothetical protein IFM89_001399 [Coptis chinensis]
MVKCWCLATMRVTKQVSGLWKVVKYVGAHNHNLVSLAKRMCMPICKNLPIVAKMLIDSFRDEVIDKEIEDVDDHKDDDDDENRDRDEDNEDRDGEEVEFKI